MDWKDVIAFWFVEHGYKDWFAADSNFDAEIHDRFSHLFANVTHLTSWRETPYGRLAEIIVLDQFSRQIFRGSSQAFAYDSLVLTAAREMIASKTFDQLATHDEQAFALMPFMHSEDLLVHNEAVPLFDRLKHHWIYRYEQRHRGILEQFGRYPYRNALLGRASSEEEEFFLQTHQGF